jgi:glycosyltransferase involved in cell wall biosynthesis
MTGGPLRLLIVNPIWPHSSHSSRAANVVIYELVAEFARRPGLKVGFLKLNTSGPEKRSDAEDAGVQALRTLGVEFLEPLNCPLTAERPSRLDFWLFPKEAYFYPEAPKRALATAAAMAFGPDMLFVPWSETATSLFADVPVAKFAYYGNPDPKSGRARAAFARAHGASWLTDLAHRISLGRMERFHLATMRHYDYLGDVAANDADYYARRGHPNAFYVRNLWIDRFGTSWRAQRADERTDPFVIVGNVGKLDGTANTQGLEILGRDVMPELRRAMRGRAFEVHIFGAGVLNPIVAAHMRAPDVHMRGFVDDIDGEIATAPVFMCLNNGSRYKVGHTRYLHAWSLGACVVAHRDVAMSMPEMVSGENCLLGNSAAEIADMVRSVADDANLRRRIGEAGYATFINNFTARSVVDQIMARVATLAPTLHGDRIR